jgi:hypothetical protein
MMVRTGGNGEGAAKALSRGGEPEWPASRRSEDGPTRGGAEDGGSVRRDGAESAGGFREQKGWLRDICSCQQCVHGPLDVRVPWGREKGRGRGPRGVQEREGKRKGDGEARIGVWAKEREQRRMRNHEQWLDGRNCTHGMGATNFGGAGNLPTSLPHTAWRQNRRSEGAVRRGAIVWALTETEGRGEEGEGGADPAAVEV